MEQSIIFKSIFGNDIGSDNKTLLQDIITANPFFGAAQYFNLKTTAVHQKNFESIAAKTNLFFSNPFYLQKIFNENATEEKTDAFIETSTAIIQVEKETIFLNENKIVETPQLAEEPLLFEPLHTSDYFASQGIKLSQVVLENDKLGKQLKSFTSWLKTMKKVHPEKLPTSTPTNDATVQKLAEKSNEEAEVYTEAMAEAYAAQGKQIRAIEIYSKLSLMFPEKSAYFAHKIENLK